MSTIARHFSTVMYSDQTDHYSQRVRMVLAEKDIAVNVINVDPRNLPQDLVERMPMDTTGLNPADFLPVLEERDLLLHESRIIMEYLDERYPHPPLLPGYPVARAECRLGMHLMERDWCPLLDLLMIGRGGPKKLDLARKELSEHLIAAEVMFAANLFLLHDELTLWDCCMTPLLWRLETAGVDLPFAKTRAIHAYMDRLFARESFQLSLTEPERDLRKSATP